MNGGAYNQGAKARQDSTVAYLTDTIEILPLSSAYVFDPDHVNGTPAGSEIAAVASYPSGWANRHLLTGKTLTNDTTLNQLIAAAADHIFTLGAGATVGSFLIQKRGGANDTTAVPLYCLAVPAFVTNGIPISVTLSTGFGITDNVARVLLCDSFTRANSALLAGSPDLGAPPVMPSTVYGINANALYAVSGFNDYILWELGITDHCLRAIVRNYGAHVLFIQVRSDNVTGDQGIYLQTLTSTTFTVQQFDNSLGLDITLYSGTHTEAANDAWELEAVGTTVKVRKNGILITTQTMTLVLNRTAVGVALIDNAQRIAGISGRAAT